MRFRALLALLALVFVIPFCASAQTTLSGLLYTFPDQHAEAAKIPPVRVSQNCQNFLWAAEIEFLARQQDVPLNQTEIADRAYGGGCIDSTIDPDKFKSVVDGDHVLPDGSHVKLEMQITSGGPLSADDLLSELIAGRSFIVTWHGHPYIAISALWDDYVYAPAQRLHKVRELKLLDPANSGEKQIVLFKADPEELSQLGSSVRLVCTKITTNPWAPAAPGNW